MGSLIVSSLNFICSILGLSLETEPVPSVELKQKKERALYTILEEDEEEEEEFRVNECRNVIFCSELNNSAKIEWFFNHQEKASEIDQMTLEPINKDQDSTLLSNDLPAHLTSLENCTSLQDIPQEMAVVAIQDSALHWPLEEVVVKPSRNPPLNSQSDDTNFPRILYDEIRRVSKGEIEKYRSIRRRADMKVISLGEYPFFRSLERARLLEQEQALKYLLSISRSEHPLSTLSRKYAREHLKLNIPRYFSQSSSVIDPAAELHQTGNHPSSPQCKTSQVISSVTFCDPAASTYVPATSTDVPVSSTHVSASSTFDVPTSSTHVSASSTFVPISSTRISASSTLVPISSTTDVPTSSTHVSASSTLVPISFTYIPCSHIYQSSGGSSIGGWNQAIQNPAAHPLHPALCSRGLGVISGNYATSMRSSTDERLSKHVQINLGYDPHTLRRSSFGDGLEYFVDRTVGWLH